MGKNNGTKVLFVGTDNRNVFDWMSKGRARSRRARSMLSRLLFWSVAKGLGIFVFFIRRGHNASADLLTRSTVVGINEWMNEKNFAENKTFRAAWSDFAAYGPGNLWGTEEEAPGIRPSIWSATKLVEWEPSSLTVTQLAVDQKCDVEVWNCRSEHAKSIVKTMGVNNALSLEGKILCGTAKTMSELDQFCEVGGRMKAKWCVMVSPSEIWHDYQGTPWGQSFWVDAVEMGGGTAGSWNVMATGPGKLEKVLSVWEKRRGGNAKRNV